MRRGVGAAGAPPALATSLLAVALAASPAAAFDPRERLEDPALEARARALSQELRCVKCQNESIDTSNADVAATLRQVVRERLVAGDSDEQVLAYVRERFGDFVLLTPPVDGGTLFLWVGPFLVGGLAVWGVARWLRRPAVLASPGAPAPAPSLTPDEEADLARRLREERG